MHFSPQKPVCCNWNKFPVVLHITAFLPSWLMIISYRCHLTVGLPMYHIFFSTSCSLTRRIFSLECEEPSFTPIQSNSQIIHCSIIRTCSLHNSITSVRFSNANPKHHFQRYSARGTRLWRQILQTHFWGTFFYFFFSPNLHRTFRLKLWNTGRHHFVGSTEDLLRVLWAYGTELAHAHAHAVVISVISLLLSS